MSVDGDWVGSIGPINYPGEDNSGGVLNIKVTATDSTGKQGSATGTSIKVAGCTVIIIF
jgi:putative peptide zinc metalloprotease protein